MSHFRIWQTWLTDLVSDSSARYRKPPYLRSSGCLRAVESARNPRRGEPYQVRQFLNVVKRHTLKLERQATTDYHINIFYSEEDRGYIADIPDLKTCSAFGRTPEAALAAVEAAKRAWLEVARATHKPIPRPLYRPAIASSRLQKGLAALLVKRDALNSQIEQLEKLGICLASSANAKRRRRLGANRLRSVGRAQAHVLPGAAREAHKPGLGPRDAARVR
jgi:predicted RNase H-like HicB family nuclease